MRVMSVPTRQWQNLCAPHATSSPKKMGHSMVPRHRIRLGPGRAHDALSHLEWMTCTSLKNAVSSIIHGIHSFIHSLQQAHPCNYWRWMKLRPSVVHITDKRLERAGTLVAEKWGSNHHTQGPQPLLDLNPIQHPENNNNQLGTSSWTLVHQTISPKSSLTLPSHSSIHNVLPPLRLRNHQKNTQTGQKVLTKIAIIWIALSIQGFKQECLPLPGRNRNHTSYKNLMQKVVGWDTPI